MTETATPPAPRISKKDGQFMIGIAVVAAAIGIALLIAHHRSTPTANPDSLATRIGAAWCVDSGYELKNRLDSSKATLYNCNMPNGAYKCVTTENGLDHDVTAEAKVAFADTFGGSRPDCVKLG